MYKEDSTSKNYLLLDCQFARALWNVAFSCLGISSAASDSIRNHLLARDGFFGRKAIKMKYRGSSSCHEYLEREKQKNF